MRTPLKNHNYRTESPIYDRYGDPMDGLDDYCDEMQELYDEIAKLRLALASESQREADRPSDETPCYASRFFRMQLVKFPLGDGTYQQCSFIGVDSHGVATVKTQGGRYRTVWDCNLYSVHNNQAHPSNGSGTGQPQPPTP